MQQWQDSGGTVASRITSAGSIAAGTAVSATAITANLSYLGPTGIGITVQGATSQTADLQRWNNSGGAILAAVRSNGRLDAYQASYVSPGAAGTVGLIVQGATSQTANLFEAQNNSGTVVMRVTSSGGILNGGLSGVTTMIGTTANAATTVGIMVRGAVSQTANLQEWQNSAGTVLASVLAGGNITATDFRTVNTLGLLGESNSGGRLYMVKATAAATNPGAGIAIMYYRDGTNAGTLKLVVRAGASGAETTILDNIPQ
jgi:hypothetical protein